MRELSRLLKAKSRCSLCEGCDGSQVVLPWLGLPGCEIFVLGRRPGKASWQVDIPFAGQAGKVLKSWLITLELSRMDCFLENLVGCYANSNRPPSRDELGMCWNMWVKKELELLRPKVIIALGLEACQVIGESEIGTVRYNKAEQLELYLPHPTIALRNKELGTEIDLLLSANKDRVHEAIEMKGGD